MNTITTGTIEERARAAMRDMLNKLIDKPGANVVREIRNAIGDTRRKIDADEREANRRIEDLTKRRAKIRTKDGAENLAHSLFDD